ncbi:GGDEF domain-containing protein [Planctomonas psychrotolerans]|uniref:GGDEF domain-containing protein n=1 Tax=Planctomonas psychrotolerans TaxID=2528712 RepID=UPI00123A98FB|nr:GGDEF domain-containing protein [Planctomonas psychrotolerans]
MTGSEAPRSPIGLAVSGPDGRLVDFDDSFAAMVERDGVVVRLGDDLGGVLRSAAVGGDSVRVVESIALRGGSVVHRLSAHDDRTDGPTGPISLPDIGQVISEATEGDDLTSVRDDLSATLISVLRARHTNERRIRAHTDEVEAQARALAEINSTLLSLSTTDSLTGLFNRRGFDAVAEQMWESARHHSLHLGIVLLDIDGFKAFNDAYGHLRGDECLQNVSSALVRTSRSVDAVARFGGEEFLVVVAAADREACGRAAERLRAAVEGLGVRHPAGGVVTVSGGYASVLPSGDVSLTQAIDRADRALYEAKHGGRNRVEAWDELLSSRPA